MERHPTQVMEVLQDIEQGAEEILTDRQQIINLDRRRNQTREAIRALQYEKGDKSWMCFGDMFIKMPNTKAKSLLQTDFNKLDDEIGEIRVKLKEKMNKLRNLENKEEIKGFGLQPLSSDELKAVNAII